ncbi:bifunctional GNAT family N-acetyltransferase/carbon-nitrogen hydrolase family protein [Cerasicoccus arenae]|uniref:Hydrolase YhcX n=1 Tax=Cerasicoccus arenae TaxID=424488 RepID=A0A8J3DLF7_9BACT|nr:bifunctional GNAT family N-acetyltransferase/carbon-nitrogen hydrolase family protein [Cerasicoccus arenae]MBK1858781.1 bifunctional GNAT family N-acetyltransferase/carbon-nitrogen hydrolase family protein [Cerasicoccus arenae]GHC07416.1 hydrolase YhcX [Cerasicoccus arenae]
MQPFTLTGPKGHEILIRAANQSDIPFLVELNKKSYPALAEENVCWREGHLRSHLRYFPQGQLVAELDGQIAGAICSLIVDMGSVPLRPHTYAGITDGGYFHNHDPRGDTLYGADVYVDPDTRGQGVGAALYEARRRLCRDLNLRRILAGGRLWNYSDHASEMTPDEYARRVEEGELKDLVLSFQLREGFILRDILKNYLPDPNSLNNASLIEWLNPDYDPPEEGQSSKVRVACVQYQVRGIKTFEDFAAQTEYFIETAADYNTEFVLFPEFFSVQLLSTMPNLAPLEAIRRLTELSGQFIELMSSLAIKYGCYIIAGSHPIASEKNPEKILNQSLIFSPDGEHVAQPKLHITPAERKYWGISGGSEVYVVDTPKAKIGVQICYDIEFPEATRYLADQGCEIIFVPYCTDNRQGYLRVKYCAQARAIENQIYVVTAGIVGNLPSVSAMDIHYGQAAVYTPSDFEFARDGIQAIADSNVETLLITDLDVSDLHRVRNTGAVRPRQDRRTDLFEIRSKLKNLPGPHADATKSVPFQLPE